MSSNGTTSNLDGYKLEGDKNNVHTLLWTFQREIISCNKYESETKCVDHIKQNNQFRLKFQYDPFKDDGFKILCLYPYCIVVDTVITSNIYHNNTLMGNNIALKSIKTKANQWKCLYSSNQCLLFSFNNTSFQEYLADWSWILKYQFKFTILNTYLPIMVPEHHLSNDLERLLLDSTYSDVMLKSAEGFEFKVHKSILSTRSTVLKAHFKHDTLQSKNNIIESKFDTEVLKEVLTYIYTDKTPRIQELADKLLEAGEFYNLPGLKTACEESLHSQLTNDNAIRTLLLADLYSATSLKDLILEFIKDGRAEVVTESDDWKSIKSVELIKTLYEFVALQ